MTTESYPTQEAVSGRAYPSGAEARSIPARLRLVSWGAIFAGTVSALGIHLLVTMLGVGLGLAAVNPITDANPGENLSIGAAAAWTVSALIALWAGGWIAGRLANPIDETTGRLHGFVVWSLATVSLFLLLSTGLGAVAGGAAKAVGKSFSALGAAVEKTGSGASDIVQQLTQRQGGAMPSMLEELTQSMGNPQSNGGHLPARATRDVGAALFHLFHDDNAADRDSNRDAVVRALTDSAGIAPDRARQMTDDWIASYDRTQKELQDARFKAEQQARVQAEKAAKATAQAAAWTFVAFVVGAVVAAYGGDRGAVSIARSEAIPATK